jgi:hypothetical protein
MKDGKPDRWEKGFNRIADLKLLQAEHDGGSSFTLND